MIVMQEDWQTVMGFLPEQWRDMAREQGALKGLRKDKDAERLLRVIMMHVAGGMSLAETAARAREAGLADLSAVALMNRLQKSERWLQQMCSAMLPASCEAIEGEVQIVDSTLVKEPGPTGSQWRIHYCLSLPSMTCRSFSLTPCKGAGTGESLRQFPLGPGDVVLADRGYSQTPGLRYAADQGARFCIRLKPRGPVLVTPEGGAFDLHGRLAELSRCSQTGDWRACLPGAAGSPDIPLRICAARRSTVAIRQVERRLRRRASKRGNALQESTLFYARYFMVITNLPEAEYSAAAVLELYRIRWQVELLFKRFKQLAQLGHLPKYDDRSSRAWLYAKLLAALITERMIKHASDFSPWGYRLLETDAPAK